MSTTTESTLRLRTSVARGWRSTGRRGSSAVPLLVRLPDLSTFSKESNAAPEETSAGLAGSSRGDSSEESGIAHASDDVTREAASRSSRPRRTESRRPTDDRAGVSTPGAKRTQRRRQRSHFRQKATWSPKMIVGFMGFATFVAFFALIYHRDHGKPPTEDHAPRWRGEADPASQADEPSGSPADGLDGVTESSAKSVAGGVDESGFLPAGETDHNEVSMGREGAIGSSGDGPAVSNYRNDVDPLVPRRSQPVASERFQSERFPSERFPSQPFESEPFRSERADATPVQQRERDWSRQYDAPGAAPPGAENERVPSDVQSPGRRPSYRTSMRSRKLFGVPGLPPVDRFAPGVARLQGTIENAPYESNNERTGSSFH